MTQTQTQRGTVRSTTAAGILTVRLSRSLSVSYDRQYNMVEVRQGRYIRCEIAPAEYTVAAFMETVRRVKEWYQIESN